MKGYSPTLNNDSKELNTKRSFIELGVKQISHKENCECEKCINNKTN